MCVCVCVCVCVYVCVCVCITLKYELARTKQRGIWQCTEIDLVLRIAGQNFRNISRYFRIFIYLCSHSTTSLGNPNDIPRTTGSEILLCSVEYPVGEYSLAIAWMDWAKPRKSSVRELYIIQPIFSRQGATRVVGGVRRQDSIPYIAPEHCEEHVF